MNPLERRESFPYLHCQPQRRGTPQRLGVDTWEPANSFKKDTRVNIRVFRKELEALRKRALEEGIPYQTLTGSILHKIVAGRLV